MIGVPGVSGDVKDGANRRLRRVLFRSRREVHPRFGETGPTCLIMHGFLDLAANELRSFGPPTPGGTSKQQRRDQIFISPRYTHEGKFNPKYESCRAIVAQGSKSEDLSRLG